jgi:uncharacterized protein YbjT (DUF2867 family)
MQHSTHRVNANNKQPIGYLKAAWEYMFRSKDIQEQMVRDSNLEWTIVRPTALIDDAPRGLAGVHPVIDQPVRRSFIARADVATFMIAQVDSNQYLHQAPALSWCDPKYSWQFW